MEDLASLQSEIKKLQEGMKSLRETVDSQQHELFLLKSGNAKLFQENQQFQNFLRENHHSQLRQQMTELNAYLNAFQADHKKVMKEQKKHRAEMGNLQVKLTDIVKNIPSVTEEMTSQGQDLTSLKDTSSALHQENQQLRADFDVLQTNHGHLQTKHNQLQTELVLLREENSKLVTDHDNLKTEMNSLQKQHGNGKTDMDRIRTDLKDLKTEMDNHQTNQKKVQTDLSTLRSEVEDLQTNQEKTQTEKNTIKTAQGKLQADMTNLSTEDDDVVGRRKTDVELETLVTKLMDKRLGEARQLFDAKRLNADKTRQSEAMIFQDVYNSEGDHYDKHSGEFSVTRHGVYCFKAGVYSRSTDVVRADIMVNGDLCCSVEGGGTDSSAEQTVTLYLTPNDRVWFRAACAGHEYGWCYFVGHTALLLS